MITLWKFSLTKKLFFLSKSSSLPFDLLSEFQLKFVNGGTSTFFDCRRKLRKISFWHAYGMMKIDLDPHRTPGPVFNFCTKLKFTFSTVPSTILIKTNLFF